jgi:hypothetical protein
VERYENNYMAAATETLGEKEITVTGTRYKNVEL